MPTLFIYTTSAGGTMPQLVPTTLQYALSFSHPQLSL